MDVDVRGKATVVHAGGYVGEVAMVHDGGCVATRLLRVFEMVGGGCVVAAVKWSFLRPRGSPTAGLLPTVTTARCLVLVAVSHGQCLSAMGVCRKVCDLQVFLLLCHQGSGEVCLVAFLLMLAFLS